MLLRSYACACETWVGPWGTKPKKMDLLVTVCMTWMGKMACRNALGIFFLLGSHGYTSKYTLVCHQWDVMVATCVLRLCVMWFDSTIIYARMCKCVFSLLVVVYVQCVCICMCLYCNVCSYMSMWMCSYSASICFEMWIYGMWKCCASECA